MALEYDLTLLTDASPGQVAERSFPGQPTTPWKHLLTMDLYDSHGFEVTIRRDDMGYVGGVDDDGAWEWEHDRPAVHVGFRLDWDRGVSADVLVTRAVARVLATGEEDAVFDINSGTVLLTRLDGVQRKHHRATWWDCGDTTTNEIIPG
jgi:hypothetical protein